MAKKVILSADFTCDLNAELMQRYDVHCIPYHIILEGKQYIDNVDIHAEDLFKAYWERKALPKTAAINVAEYTEWFRQWTDQGLEVVHIGLSSGITASTRAAALAAEELPGVYIIDSLNLSTGCAHLVIQAAKLIEADLPGAEVAEKVKGMIPKVHTSFILNTLEFMHAGGRCSGVAKFGANLLGLKPCIEMDNATGTMSVGKKYRGDYKSVLVKYVKDKLAAYSDIDPYLIFITHTTTDPENVELVRKTIQEIMHFDEIIATDASCTISCHCGPDTLGILFMTK